MSEQVAAMTPVGIGAGKKRWYHGARAFAYFLNLPAMLIITILVAYPVIYAFVLSFYYYNLRRPRRTRFVWLNNYVDIVTDPFFWSVMKVTIYFVAVSVVLLLAIGMALALLLNEEFKGRGIVRSLVLIPWAIPPVVNGLMWQGILNGTYGVLNGILYRLGFIESYIGWLTQPFLALNMTAFAHVWNNVPFCAIVLLANLQAIPGEQYQAAQVDGANTLQRFWNITMPWLTQAILIILIYQTMHAFRVFDIIYTLTAGGPAYATHLLAWQTYMTAFGSYDFGHGNAYSYLITLITMSLAVFYIRMLYRRAEVQG